MGEVYTWRLILSQINLAACLGVEDSTVNKMEAGSRRPLVEVLGLKVTFTLQAEHSDLTDQEVDGPQTSSSTSQTNAAAPDCFFSYRPLSFLYCRAFTKVRKPKGFLWSSIKCTTTLREVSLDHSPFNF